MVFYTSSSGPQSNFTISPESCTNSVCQHTLNMPSAADYTVSVAAVNVVGQRRSEDFTDSLLVSQFMCQDQSK